MILRTFSTCILLLTSYLVYGDEKCDLGAVDLIFLLQSRYDLPEPGFLQMKVFIKNFIATIDMGRDTQNTRIGVMTYDGLNEPEYKIHLSSYGRASDASIAIDQIGRSPCGSWCAEKADLSVAQAAQKAIEIFGKETATGRMKKIVVIRHGQQDHMQSEQLRQLTQSDAWLKVEEILIHTGTMAMDDPYGQYLNAYYQPYERYLGRMHQMFPNATFRDFRRQYNADTFKLLYDKNVDNGLITVKDFSQLATLGPDLCAEIFSCPPCDGTSASTLNSSPNTFLETSNSGDANRKETPNESSVPNLGGTTSTKADAKNGDYEYEIVGDPPGLTINSSPASKKQKKDAVSANETPENIERKDRRFCVKFNAFAQGMEEVLPLLEAALRVRAAQEAAAKGQVLNTRVYSPPAPASPCGAAPCAAQPPCESSYCGYASSYNSPCGGCPSQTAQYYSPCSNGCSGVQGWYYPYDRTPLAPGIPEATAFSSDEKKTETAPKTLAPLDPLPGIGAEASTSSSELTDTFNSMFKNTDTDAAKTPVPASENTDSDSEAVAKSVDELTSTTNPYAKLRDVINQMKPIQKRRLIPQMRIFYLLPLALCAVASAIEYEKPKLVSGRLLTQRTSKGGMISSDNQCLYAKWSFTMEDEAKAQMLRKLIPRFCGMIKETKLFFEEYENNTTFKKVFDYSSETLKLNTELSINTTVNEFLDNVDRLFYQRKFHFDQGAAHQTLLNAAGIAEDSDWDLKHMFTWKSIRADVQYCDETDDTVMIELCVPTMMDKISGDVYEMLDKGEFTTSSNGTIEYSYMDIPTTAIQTSNAGYVGIDERYCKEIFDTGLLCKATGLAECQPIGFKGCNSQELIVEEGFTHARNFTSFHLVATFEKNATIVGTNQTLALDKNIFLLVVGRGKQVQIGKTTFDNLDADITTTEIINIEELTKVAEQTLKTSPNNKSGGGFFRNIFNFFGN
ncbi:unnamed protein product, partial [Mesorhabditis spiculigera]